MFPPCFVPIFYYIFDNLSILYPNLLVITPDD
nr:MAG TPA: hypothetical protein [Caudoviricetes sp.]